MSDNSEPTRLAVVGLRIHAGGLEPDRDHGLIKSFHGRDDACIVAYCEWDPDEAAALESLSKHDPSAQIYTSLEELLDREAFEAAVVMLPPNEATPASMRLAEAGKHLFIEKQPPAPRPRSCPSVNSPPSAIWSLESAIPGRPTPSRMRSAAASTKECSASCSPWKPDW